MKRNISFTLLLVLSFLTTESELFSQDKTLISPYIQLQYFKNTNDQRILKTTLTYSKNRMELPLAGMEVNFYTGGSIRELLGTVITDNKGVSQLELSKDKKPDTDNTGMWAFSTEYKGNDTIEAGSSEISVKDVILDMSYSEADSIKTITAKAFTREKGKEIPVKGETVLVYVPRMFSLLQIGEISLDDSGNGSLEFPSDLPGNKEGSIIIITKFEENATFGNVEKQTELKWGVPTDYSQPSSHRALWTKTAPRWMIYTLSILLAGVWGHYMLAMAK
jgi:hypothetical protein